MDCSQVFYYGFESWVIDWRWGSSGRVPALYTWSPEFNRKPVPPKKKKNPENYFWAGGVAQEVEYLYSKYEGLGSNLSMEEKKIISNIRRLS
jgi:hypothetical protein